MNSRLIVGIIAQQSYTIGLFEIFFLPQSGRRERIAWFKPYRSPFSEWVRPQAVLEEDPELLTMTRESVDLLTTDYMRMDREGRVYNLTRASLLRIPYVVSFWEQTDLFPVFSIYPDYDLQWSYTVRSSIHVPPARPRDLIFLPRPLPAAASISAPRSVDSAVRRASVGVLESDAICPISMEPLGQEEAVWTPCGHAFSDLLAHALERDARCPLCRAPCVFEECARTT